MKRRIFVLGAGFSAAYGYPTVEKLFEEIMKIERKKSKEILHLLSKYYPHFRPKYKNYPNIEEFLGFLQIDKEMSISTGGERRPQELPQEPFLDDDRKKIEKIENFLIELISKYFFERLNQPLPPHLKKFCENLKDRDVIISFNWDLLLEKCLHEIGKKYSYSWGDYFDRKTEILILKPHGSINWIIADKRCNEEETKKLEENGFLHYGDYRTFGFTNFEYREIQKGFIRCIIPPTACKKFTFPQKLEREEKLEVPGHLDVTWKGIWSTLSEKKEKICFIGYSLPDYDLPILYIFRSIFRRIRKDSKSVEVVNPDFSVYTNYMHILGKDFIFLNSKFENIDIERDLFN